MQVIDININSSILIGVAKINRYISLIEGSVNLQIIHRVIHRTSSYDIKNSSE